MLKSVAAILVFAMCLSLCAGCKSEAVENTLLPGSDGLTSVTVTSMPEGYDYSFSGESAKTLAQCITDMELTVDFPEDPNGYAGMTWVITARYEDGTAATVYLFGNLFIRAGDGPWFQVSANEAEHFETLLTSLS